jgi:hypothetical protein
MIEALQWLGILILATARSRSRWWRHQQVMPALIPEPLMRWFEAESTRTVLMALREVVERRGLFGSLYSDRASHFFLTPKAGEPVDRHGLTTVGRALQQLGIDPIPERRLATPASEMPNSSKHTSDPEWAGQVTRCEPVRAEGPPAWAGLDPAE